VYVYPVLHTMVIMSLYMYVGLVILILQFEHSGGDGHSISETTTYLLFKTKIIMN